MAVGFLCRILRDHSVISYLKCIHCVGSDGRNSHLKVFDEILGLIGVSQQTDKILVQTESVGGLIKFRAFAYQLAAG